MFIRFDVIHERDGQTDRQTLRDSKDRSYASHRAVKTVWRPASARKNRRLTSKGRGGDRMGREAMCYQWFKQRLILSVSRSHIKEDIEHSVIAREFNLKAYAAIT